MLLLAAAPIPTGQSHGSAPSSGNRHSEPQAHAGAAQRQTTHNAYGTEDNPAFVQLEDSDQQKQEADKHATYEKQEAANDWWIATFTVILGIVGILELVILSLQIYWMSRTVTDSNKQHALTERAYVVPGTFKREISTAADSIRSATEIELAARAGFPSFNADEELNVTFFGVHPVWANPGNTPTVQMRIRVDWADGGARAVGSYRSQWEPFFIAPKSSETSEFIEMPGLNALIQGGAGIIGRPLARLIWGIAEYRDVFGKGHWLRWCYSIRPSRPVPGQGIRISFIQSGNYNGSGDGDFSADNSEDE